MVLVQMYWQLLFFVLEYSVGYASVVKILLALVEVDANIIDHLVAFWAGALVVAVCVSALGWSGTFVSICCAFVNVLGKNCKKQLLENPRVYLCILYQFHR